MNSFLQSLQSSKVLCAIRSMDKFDAALESRAEFMIFLTGDIFSLEEKIRLAHRRNKKVLVHAELISGVKQDRAGIRYIGKKLGADGLITTRRGLILQAREEGLWTVQRLFVLDSAALTTGMEVVKKTSPDAIEVLPGIAAPHFASIIKKETHLPIIAGGLIRTSEDLKNVLEEKDILAVSTSESSLWNPKQ